MKFISKEGTEADLLRIYGPSMLFIGVPVTPEPSEDARESDSADEDSMP